MTYTLKNKITGDVYRDIPGDDLHRFDVRIFDIVEQTSEGDALILQDFVEGHLGMQENRKKWIEARFIIDDRWMGWGDFIFTTHNYRSEYPERTRKDFPARCMGRTPEGEFWKELP
jgi:hypothetical protein